MTPSTGETTAFGLRRWHGAGAAHLRKGLLRDYFPKHTDLRGHSADRLVAVAAQINMRPRKTPDWATAADLFGSQLTPAQ